MKELKSVFHASMGLVGSAFLNASLLLNSSTEILFSGLTILTSVLSV